MSTVNGLFTAGDGSGASPHKFSSGSFAEGRLAGKAAIAYSNDNPSVPAVSDTKLESMRQQVYQPFQTFEENKGATTTPEVNPQYLMPKQGLMRLQKIMDEYAAGVSTWYRTSEPMLKRGLELIGTLKEDFAKLAARDSHELLRCWELNHRIWTAEAHIRHMLFRQETRWPGYYYRVDHPDINDQEWRVFVNSKYDSETGEWKVFKKPYIQTVK
jgi:adenylylsulfate reductase subunit A